MTLLNVWVQIGSLAYELWNFNSIVESGRYVTLKVLLI